MKLLILLAVILLCGVGHPLPKQQIRANEKQYASHYRPSPSGFAAVITAQFQFHPRASEKTSAAQDKTPEWYVAVGQKVCKWPWSAILPSWALVIAAFWAIGQMFLYAYGRVDYETIGELRFTQFCYRWYSPIGLTVGNDPDGFRKGGPAEYNRCT
jgi:hypothetical protein